MAHTSQTSRDALADQLSSRMESLQEGFRRLSNSATVKDLASRFADVVREVIPALSVSLAHRASGGEWESLQPAGASGLKKLSTLDEQNIPGSVTVVNDSDGMCIVQKLADASSVGLVAVPKKKTSRFSPLDIVSCRLFLHLFDTAYQNIVHRRKEKDLIFSLNHRILQLNSLIETGIEVARLEDNEAPHHLALIRAASMMNASMGVVRVTVERKIQEQYTFPEDATIKRVRKDEPFHIASRFKFLQQTFTFELFNKESRSGVQPFEETDQLLLDALSRQVHASLENRYLYKQSLEKQRIEQDLAVAASIQRRILPAKLPTITGYELAGVNIPSKSIGGDYFHCLPLPNGTYALVIADVAGKGIQAALLVSSLHAYLSAYLEGLFTLTELVDRLNKVLYHDSTDDKFITAFIAILMPENGEIEYLNAGHNPAYILRNNGHVDVLDVAGLPLAMLDMGVVYESRRVTLGRGESLLLFTDGVTEAQNAKREQFEDIVPLPEYLTSHRTEQAEQFVSQLMKEIEVFSGSTPQTDDITVLYLRRE